jgi:hypothetical protein
MKDYINFHRQTQFLVLASKSDQRTEQVDAFSNLLERQIGKL